MILADRYFYPPDFYDKSRITLETALNTAPAYSVWKTLDPGANVAVDLRYDAMPGLTKQMIRDHFPMGLVPNRRNVEEGLLNEEIEYTYTSGTTGDRVINIWDQNWWDRAEAASWKLNAHTAKLTYPQREAKLASSLNVGISCEEDLPISHRLVGEKLYLNEKINLVQWLPRHYKRMAAELNSFKPAILEANPSLLARLAFWALDEGVEIFSPSVIIFTYEFVSKIHLAAIKKVFSCPTVSSFGTTETGFVLEECEAGFLHQNIAYCRIDFQPLKERFGGPELGRMYVTTFDNPWNTVVKFDTGDLVRLHPSGECACGRKEGLIAEGVEGRTSNSTFSVDGRLITTQALDRALSVIPGLRDYNLEQHGQARYELQIMLGRGGDCAACASGATSASDASGKSGATRVSDASGALSKSCASNALDAARGVLQSLYGSDCDFDIKVLKNILPGPAGKFRRTRTNLDIDWDGLFI